MPPCMLPRMWAPSLLMLPRTSVPTCMLPRMWAPSLLMLPRTSVPACMLPRMCVPSLLMLPRTSVPTYACFRACVCLLSSCSHARLCLHACFHACGRFHAWLRACSCLAFLSMPPRTRPAGWCSVPARIYFLLSVATGTAQLTQHRAPGRLAPRRVCVGAALLHR